MMEQNNNNSKNQENKASGYEYGLRSETEFLANTALPRLSSFSSQGLFLLLKSRSDTTVRSSEE